MAGFRLWGRIEQIATEFVVTATAVPENGDPAGVRTLTEGTGSRESAERELKRLMARIGEIVREAGGTITATQIDAG